METTPGRDGSECCMPTVACLSPESEDPVRDLAAVVAAASASCTCKEGNGQAVTQGRAGRLLTGATVYVRSNASACMPRRWQYECPILSATSHSHLASGKQFGNECGGFMQALSPTPSSSASMGGGCPERRRGGVRIPA